MKALKKAPERFVEVGWDGDNEASYRVELQIDAYDRTRLLEDLSRTFSEAGINILGASCTTNHPMVKNRFVVEVGDTEQLKHCISRLRNVESVFDAYRITPAAVRSGLKAERIGQRPPPGIARAERRAVDASARRCSRRRPGPGRGGSLPSPSSEIEAMVAAVTSSKCSIWRWLAAGRLSLKRRAIRVGMSRWAARLSTATESVPSSIAIPSQTRIGRLAK